MALTELLEVAISWEVSPTAIRDCIPPSSRFEMSSSVPIITDLAWRSERLIYRAIDKQTDGEFIERIHNIPLVRSTFESNLTAPTSKGYAEDKLRKSEEDLVQ